MKSGMIVDTIKLIVTTEKVGIEDFFSETEKSHTTYETVKETIAKDPKLAAMLQDPNLSAQDKEAMLNQVTASVMEKLGYKAQDNKIVAQDDGLAGHYDRDSNTAYINDLNNDSTEALVNTAGHEMAHAMDNQDKVNDTYSQADRETYASLYGSNFADYTDMALDINGYNDGMASSNNHTGNDSIFVQNNNNEYDALNKSEGDNCFGLCTGTAVFLTTLYLMSGSKDANAPYEDEIPTESDMTFISDVIEEAAANKLEAETGIPAIVLMSLDPKLLAKKGIKNADELIEAIRRGDVDPKDLKKTDGDVLNKTPRAARRQAMRDAGIPTSQQPVSQRSVRAGDGTPAGRQYDYDVPAQGGGTTRNSVQHSLTDQVPGHGPHWEAGPVKPLGQQDSLGLPRLQNGKAKVDE